MNICKKCILTETFPGVSFDEKNICNHCRREEASNPEVHEKKAQYRQRLDDLIGEVKGKGPTFDALMAYSGGKDSSYTLKLLKERYGLRILALTFDNDFVSPVAWENIKKVADRLEIDQISFRPPWPILRSMFSLAAYNDVFAKPTLLRASTICTACIGLVKSLTLKTALEMAIPLVCFGWSPGQAPIQSAVMKTNPNLIRKNQATLYNAFPKQERLRLAPYFIPDAYYENYKERFPHNIHPLAFFDYDERNIKSALVALGWKNPEDTDSNSTNCLLNALANQCHFERHGFHPYLWEIANMVRQGVMSRDEGLEKIAINDRDRDLVTYAKMKLGL